MVLEVIPNRKKPDDEWTDDDFKPRPALPVVSSITKFYMKVNRRTDDHKSKFDLYLLVLNKENKSVYEKIDRNSKKWNELVAILKMYLQQKRVNFALYHYGKYLHEQQHPGKAGSFFKTELEYIEIVVEGALRNLAK